MFFSLLAERFLLYRKAISCKVKKNRCKNQFSASYFLIIPNQIL